MKQGSLNQTSSSEQVRKYGVQACRITLHPGRILCVFLSGKGTALAGYDATEYGYPVGRYADSAIRTSEW